MGRPAGFTTPDAVRAAREVFWREGYEGTSMAALREATGLNPSSLYHAFGSKRGLFDAAIEEYLAHVVRPGLTGLLDPGVGPGEVLAYLERVRGIVLDPAAEGLPEGCLLVSTACSGIARDPAVAAVVSGYRALLADALGRGVAARFPGRDAAGREHLTGTLVATVVAALALTRADRRAAAGLLDAALAQLRASDAADPAGRTP